MTRRSLLPLLAALACVPGAVQAQDPNSVEPETQRNRTVFLGEITDLEETSFRMKPWHHKLPSRIQVTASSATRYLRQVDGSRERLQPGDAVLVVEDRRPAVVLKPKRDENSDEREARMAKQAELRAEAAAKPGNARAVLRLWAAQGELTADDEKLAASLLAAANGRFDGRARGSVPRPGKGEPRWLGVVKSVKPLTITVHSVSRPDKDEDEPKVKERVFETYRETVWLDHLPGKPEDLKKGKTVTVRTATPLGADGTIQALTITQCVEPNRSPERERRLILRERKRRD